MAAAAQEKGQCGKGMFKGYLPRVKNPIKNFPLFHSLFATFLLGWLLVQITQMERPNLCSKELSHLFIVIWVVNVRAESRAPACLIPTHMYLPGPES